MAEKEKASRMSRRGLVTGLGMAGIALAYPTTKALAQTSGDAATGDAMGNASEHLTVESMRAQAAALKVGDWARTLGFHEPGDGGAALYRIEKRAPNRKTNEADAIALDTGKMAVLHERRAVNYKMFGAVGDGKNDDGVQIKLAHEYANQFDIPVVNTAGEFWIIKTNRIPIRTNVQWGKTVLHIDERQNTRRDPRFVVENDEKAKALTTDEKVRKALIEKLKPGAQIIPELAPYAGCLFSVRDSGDRIGIRAGYKGNKGWPREELFYVEEEGRIVGDIAWTFRNFTSIQAIPTNRNFVVLEGGGFLLSGHTPADGKPGYHANGFSIRRSRTIIRDQWMGLEPGNADESIEPRSGFYSLGHVFNVTLENIHAMPWVYKRQPPAQSVKHGTYGIGGSRMLNCTFRNITAEAGWPSWGVFGTNLNKNFRIEKCHLNRVDVHFHCWGLYISDCVIGFKGISMTGGGELVVENTVRHGNNFIHFRPDYGSKWDGPIRVTNCTLRPNRNGQAAVLSYRPRDFDYKYPIGLATSIVIDNMRIDYSGVPQNDDPCWLVQAPTFSRIKQGARLFFPHTFLFRDVNVEGRKQGVRLMQLPDPWHFDVRREGGYDDNGLRPNCNIVCERVALERTEPDKLDQPGAAQFVLGGAKAEESGDPLALYPRIVFSDCDHVAVLLKNCAAAVTFERCSINMLTALDLRGALAFTSCDFRPHAPKARGRLYSLDSTQGTRLTNCTLYSPIIGGKPTPAMIDAYGFIVMNKTLAHSHVNTMLGRGVVDYWKQNKDGIEPAFVDKLKTRHELEE